MCDILVTSVKRIFQSEGSVKSLEVKEENIEFRIESKN